jgi:hypothetical protein
MNVLVLSKVVYGRTLYYPMNREAAALAKIAGSSTLTIEALTIAKNELGAKIVEQHVPTLDTLISAAGSVA